METTQNYVKNALGNEVGLNRASERIFCQVNANILLIVQLSRQKRHKPETVIVCVLKTYRSNSNFNTASFRHLFRMAGLKQKRMQRFRGTVLANKARRQKKFVRRG